MMAINPPSAEELARHDLSAKKVRARNEDGTLKGDDPSTPEVNEAWTTKLVKKVSKSAAKRKKRS